MAAAPGEFTGKPEIISTTVTYGRYNCFPGSNMVEFGRMVEFFSYRVFV